MTRGEPLDERYFTWLCRKVGIVADSDPTTSHWILAKRLYNTRFVYFVPNDDNRAIEGEDLREEFFSRHPQLRRDRNWMSLDCSVLEMLIALARRAAFHTDPNAFDGGLRGWFWLMLDNVRLSRYTDIMCNDRVLEAIDDVLDKINNRTYRYNGRGGLFPLRRPKRDQRDVELWYQLQAYLLENRYVIP